MKKTIFSMMLLCAAVTLASCSDDDDPKAVAVSQVTLSKATLSLEAGKTETLAATVSPTDATDKAVKWTTSNKDVATVSDAGLVTAVAVGEATITATSAADATKKATCVVKVSARVIAVTGVTLDKATAELKTAETLTLTATVAPADATDKSLTWTTSNSAIATVSDAGVVTAVAPGQATITAASVADATKKDECVVTVKAPVVPPTGITLNKDYLAINKGDTETLVATVLPANLADQSVTWTTDNASCATVSSTGVVTAVGTGSCYITATSVANPAMSAECEIYVKRPPMTATLTLNVDHLTVGEALDGKVTATVTYENAKGNGFESFTIVITPKSYVMDPNDFTYTATNGLEQVWLPINIPEGQTSGSFTVGLIGTPINAGTETYILNQFGGANDSVTIPILPAAGK